MKAWIRGSLSIGTATLFVSACVLVEDFQGYEPSGAGSTCDKPPCPGVGGSGGSSITSASSGENSTASGSSSSVSSSGSGGTSLTSSSSSSSSSSSGSSSSSSSSGDPGTPGNVSCDDSKCIAMPGNIGCCYVDAVTATCVAAPLCMGPIFYCDGREDCGGLYCCFNNTEGSCNATCDSNTYLCLEDQDCPPGRICNTNAYVNIGQCSQ